MKWDEIVKLGYDQFMRRNEDLEYVTRCKDCKYFETDYVVKLDGMPLILGEVCTKWGKGCKTNENGYCFLAERKEVKDDHKNM